MKPRLNQADRLLAMQPDAEALAILQEARPLIAQHIDAAVDQQRTATQEIAQRVQEVARSSGLASSSMESVTAAAAQTGTAAQAAAGGMDELTAESKHLTTQADRFLGRIRSAA